MGKNRQTHNYFGSQNQYMKVWVLIFCTDYLCSVTIYLKVKLRSDIDKTATILLSENLTESNTYLFMYSCE